MDFIMRVSTLLQKPKQFSTQEGKNEWCFEINRQSTQSFKHVLSHIKIHNHPFYIACQSKHEHESKHHDSQVQITEKWRLYKPKFAKDT